MTVSIEAQIKFKRGTTTQRLAVTPAVGEPIWDTDEKRFYIGDGVTAGGVVSGAATAHEHSGADITTGTVADTRLSPNVPLKNTANTFTQVQTFGASDENGAIIGNVKLYRRGNGAILARSQSAGVPTSIGVSANGSSGSSLEFFLTDFSADSTNFTRLIIYGIDDANPIRLFSNNNGTKTRKPFAIYADKSGFDLTGNQLYLATTGEVGVGKVPTAGVKLDVAGSVAINGGTAISKILSATATLDFPSIGPNLSASLTITVTGAAVGDSVQVNPSSIEAGLTWCGYVSAVNTVQIRVANSTAAAIDPVAATWRATVTKF